MAFLSFDMAATWIMARIKHPSGVGRGVLAGIGAAYCVTEKKKIHLPIAILAPGFYCGANLWLGWSELVDESRAIVEGVKAAAKTTTQDAAATLSVTKTQTGPDSGTVSVSVSG